MTGLNLESSEKLLDQVGWDILRELQEDARIPFSELGRRVGLSAPAVTERVRRMEEAGIIKGYRAEINLKRVGLSVLALVRLNTSMHPHGCKQFLKMAPSIPEIIECHRITGSDSYLMKVAVPSLEDLEKVLDQINVYGATTTVIALSSPVEQRIIDEMLFQR